MRDSNNDLSRQRAACLAAYLALSAACIIFLWRTFLPSLTAMTHSYPAYYAASRLVLEQRWTAQVYDNTWFEARVMEFTAGHVSDRFSLHPPTTSLLLVPIAWLDLTTARVLWQLFNLALLLLGLWLTVRALSLSALARILFFSLAFLYPPLAENVRVGQTYVLVWFCFALALWSETRAQPISAGVGLGLAAALKLSGVPILLLLAARKQWRTLGYTILVIALASLLGLLVLGGEGWLAFFQRVFASLGSTPSAAHAAYQTTSSFFQKLLVSSPDFNPTPLWDAPWLAPILYLATSGLALSLTLWYGRRAAFATAFAAAVTLSVILFPQALEYHYTLLLVPFAVMLAKLSGTRTRWDVVWFTAILLLLYLPFDGNTPYWNERQYVFFAYPRLLWRLVVVVMAVETNVNPAVGGGRRLAVGRNTLILLVSNFSSAALGLVISILIARGAGDAALGTYSLALAWALTLAQFADLGMSTLLTRDLARTPQHTASYLRASLVAKTALGLVLTLGLVLAAPALVSGSAGTTALQLGAALIVLNAWYTSFTAVFRAFGRMMPILVLNVMGLVIQTAVTWFLISIAAPVAALVALAVAIQAVQVIAAWFFYSQQIPAPHDITRNDWRNVWQYAAQLTRASIPFAIAGILGSLELRANIFLLGALDGERAVGWYSAASRLNDGIRLAPNAFFGAVLPALAALGATQNQQQLRQFFQKREWALIGFGGAAALCLSLLAPRLVPFLYGDAFAPAIPVLIVLGWGLIPALVTGLLILYLYARGDEQFVNWLIGIGLVVQVALALVLLRVYGAPGAAAATLLSDCVVWFLLRRRIAQLERGTPTNWRALAFTIVPPLALFLLATLVRFIPLWQNSFDGLYGQDAYAYYEYARTLFSSLTHGQLPPPFFWSLGYPFLLNLAFLFGGVSIASAQTITIVCGALVAPAAYALAYETAPNGYKNAAGWTAGLVCALSGQLVQSSVVIMSDAPALLFATLAAWLLLRYARTRQTITLSFAALAAGMAVWSRWQNLIFATVWFAALLLIEWQFVRRPRTAAKSANPLLRATSILVLALTLFLLVLSPQTVIRSTTNTTPAGTVWLEGWSPANFFARTFDNQDGHFDYPLPVAVFYGQVFAHPAYLVALLTPLFLAGIAALLYHILARTRANGGGGRNPEREWVAAVLLLGWILANYLFLAGIPYQNFRFNLGMLPPIAVLTGIGAGWFWQRWHSSRLRFVLVGWIVLALLVMTLWQPRVLAPVLATKAGELDQAQWLTQQLPPSATVWTLSLEGALKTYTTFSVANIWEKSATELTASAPSYLVVDVSSLETQWRDKPVSVVFRTLRDSGNLTLLGSLANYSLFQISK